jgi:hypothetical protein
MWLAQVWAAAPDPLRDSPGGEVELRQVPRFLTVYEFTAGSADQVVAAMHSLNERLTKADRMSDLFVESGSAVFQQIRDERR